MDYFFTSRTGVRRDYESVPGLDLDAWGYVTRPGALKDGTPFFLRPDMRPLEPHCSFFRELAKTLQAKSMQDYTYDLLDLDDFLGRLDPPSDLLAATEDDLVAYRDDCTEHRDVPVGPATWKRRRATINNFYDWATATGLLAQRPYLRRKNGRDILSWGTTTALDVRHLTFEQWWFLDRIGLRGLLPDGSADPSFRSDHALRDSCGGNLSVTTGMRLREFSTLFDIEVGPARRDGSAKEVELEAIAKFGLHRIVEVQDAMLRDLDWYRRTERARAIRKSAKTLYRHRADLFVVDNVDLRKMKVSGILEGRRRTYSVKTMKAPLRRITVVEGEHGLEPMALFVGRHGRMISSQRWEQVFDDAHARTLRIATEYGVPLEMPNQVRIHDLRHTYAIFMLEQLTELVAARDAEQFRLTGRRPAYAADHMSRNPFLTVMRLLGHRNPGSTMRYLTYRRKSNLLVAQAVRNWTEQDRTYADLAAREAGRWGA
ncbi:site-specific integrase [Streptomyces sp. BE20]|uniref:site-specific integrase n=1 Tax=Streptomyces sp. BE20 TaxID=3002525 RepID=UPI002E774707|nr:site-specific integrase [Streptomyces sp. BE20]MEE1823780.1 site-specific integrase [Streptomyces sp. BE20]